MLIIRALVFSDDGTGASIVIGLFWLIMLALFLKLVVGLRFDKRGWEYGFLIVAVAAFTASAILGKHTVGHGTFIIFVVSLLGFLIMWFRNRRKWKGTTMGAGTN
jgi:hypothetical protein